MTANDENQVSSETDDPIKAAAQAWIQYTLSSESLVHLTHKCLPYALVVPDFYRTQNRDEVIIRRVEWEAGEARKEIEAGFPNLHAHTLLGLHGALECFVEDIFVAMIQSDPDILSSEAFGRMKLPASLLFSSDTAAKYSAILSEATRSTNSDLTVGATKHERLLGLVGLSGHVPEIVRRALFQGQQIRNIWAHRGGIADQKFVAACPDRDYKVGEKVNMPPSLFLPLMHGMHMYGLIVINRVRDRREEPRILSECHGYEGCLSEIYTA